MKRFWLVLLALGMLFAFSSSVLAADVKFTGSYYAAGVYQDNANLIDESYTYVTLVSTGTVTATALKTITNGPASAFYYQRLRVNMEFIATPALKLVTRFDAMERIWGGVRSAAGVARDIDSYGTRAENENIAFDYTYIWYASKIGLWQVGIMEDGAWGTKFGDNSQPEGKITWLAPLGSWIVGLQIVKMLDNSRAYINAAGYGTQNDVDQDKYHAFAIYNFKGGSAGLLAVYLRGNTKRPAISGFPANVTALPDQYRTEALILLPYFKAKIGPVALEGELNWATGKVADWDIAGRPDVKLDVLNAYLDATADLGMFYFGATGAYLSGDKPGSQTKLEAGVINGGRDWAPTLIMFNNERNYWIGPMQGYLFPAPPVNLLTQQPQMGAQMSNAWFGQLRAGVRPVADLDIMASVSYAQAVRNAAVSSSWMIPVAFAGLGGTEVTTKKDYGWEVDVTATYRITNNLTYMLGGGYFFTGDYFKGLDTSNKVKDNFLIINKLTLTF